MSAINYSERITPTRVKVLDEGEIFVFGSNARGMHMGGAARFAQEKFGAIMGVGEGIQGQSYAIPTMEGIENMVEAVDRFISFAEIHPEMTFYVTEIGCGIAGYLPKEIAPLFRDAIELENVFLPLRFWKILTQ